MSLYWKIFAINNQGKFDFCNGIFSYFIFFSKICHCIVFCKKSEWII